MGDMNRLVKNRKGFYVKMRFFKTKNEKNGKPFLVRYFKWVLWFSLSFYFFGKFLNGHEPSTSGLKTTMVNHSHRALSESVVVREDKDDHGLLNDLKVYVYELPSKYNSDWLSNDRCSNHLFASEVAIHKALMKSDFRTFDPTEADFFFVPVYVSCNFSTVNGFPAIGHARALLSSAVELISSELPFWKRE
ncbi:putative exostosin [Helianthus annuus]|nr:putative exostosin [Helianthus annuus]